MAVYRCRFCGSVYDEEKEGTKVSELKVCPVCRVASDKMVPADGGAKKTASDEGTSGGPVPAEHVQPAPGPAAHSPARCTVHRHSGAFGNGMQGNHNIILGVDLDCKRHTESPYYDKNR